MYVIVSVEFTPGIRALYVHNKTMKKTQLFLDSHQSRALKTFLGNYIDQDTLISKNRYPTSMKIEFSSLRFRSIHVRRWIHRIVTLQMYCSLST